MADKAVNLTQLAFRAGKIAKGSFLIPSIQKNQADLVLISEETGANSRKKIINKCTFYKVPLIELPALAFNSIASMNSSAIAICDKNFAQQIYRACGLNDSYRILVPQNDGLKDQTEKLCSD